MHIRLSRFKGQIEASADYLISRRDPDNYGWGLNIVSGHQASSIVNTTEALFVINKASRKINNLDKTIEFLKHAIKKHPKERGNNLRYLTFGVWGLLEAGLEHSDPFILEIVKEIEDRIIEGIGWSNNYDDRNIRLWPTFQSLWIISKIFGAERITTKYQKCLTHLLTLGRTNSYRWGSAAGEKESLASTSYALILLAISYPESPDTIETHKSVVNMLTDAMDKNKPLEVEPIAGTDWHHYAYCWALKSLYSSPCSLFDIDTIKITAKVLEYIATLFREGCGYVEPGKQICNVRSIFNNVLAIEAVNQNFDPLNYIHLERLLKQEHVVGNKIFIIHGHDNEMKKEVQLLLERADLDDVVLHECPDKGRTIMDKLIEEGDSACYVIALLSPDDITADSQYRATQNVILEIGYFIGKLGKARVRLLKKGNIEIPSDLSGILYENFDDAGSWKIKILKEMQEVGIKCNIEKVVQKY